MKFAKLLIACGAAGVFSRPDSIFNFTHKRTCLIAPRYSRAPGECDSIESRRRYEAALAKRERKAAKLRKENP